MRYWRPAVRISHDLPSPALGVGGQFIVDDPVTGLLVVPHLLHHVGAHQGLYVLLSPGECCGFNEGSTEQQDKRQQ